MIISSQTWLAVTDGETFRPPSVEGKKLAGFCCIPNNEVSFIEFSEAYSQESQVRVAGLYQYWSLFHLGKGHVIWDPVINTASVLTNYS